MNPYILLVGNHNPDMNIIHCIRFKLEGAVEAGPRTQFSQFFAGFMVWGNILTLRAPRGGGRKRPPLGFSSVVFARGMILKRNFG